MGILSKISENDHSARLEKQQSCDKQSLLARIRQTYPAAAQERRAAADASRTSTEVDKQPEEPRDIAVAIQSAPGEPWDFDASLSQAERLEIIAAWEAFDRMDARKTRNFNRQHRHET